MTWQCHRPCATDSQVPPLQADCTCTPLPRPSTLMFSHVPSAEAPQSVLFTTLAPMTVLLTHTWHPATHCRHLMPHRPTHPLPQCGVSHRGLAAPGRRRAHRSFHGTRCLHGTMLLDRTSPAMQRARDAANDSSAVTAVRPAQNCKTCRRRWLAKAALGAGGLQPHSAFVYAVNTLVK
jgi:hypothetical protein